MKKVLYIIEVPENDFCFGSKSYECCEHFDNEGGIPECSLLGWGLLDRCKETGAVKKHSECLVLKEL